MDGNKLADSRKLAFADRLPVHTEFAAERTVRKNAANGVRKHGRRTGAGGSGHIAQGDDIRDHMELCGNGNRLIRNVQRSVDGIVARFAVDVFGNVLPLNGTADRRAVCHRAGSRCFQSRSGTGLHTVITHHGVAGKSSLRAAVLHGLCRDLCAAASQAGGGHIDGEAARILRRADNDQRLACIGCNVCALGAGQNAGLLELARGGLIAVVHAHDLAVSGQGELNGIGCRGIQMAIGILRLNLDVNEALAVRIHNGLVLRDLQFGHRTRRGNSAAAGSFGDLLAVFTVSLGGNGAVCVSHIERSVQAGSTGGADRRADAAAIAADGIGIVGVARAAGMCAAGGRTDQAAVAVQLHLRGIGVNHHGGLAAGGIHIVAVPRGDQMQGGAVLVPLAAVQVIGILFKARSVYNAEIAAVRRCADAGHRAAAGAVPRRRLADVIPAGPDEFTGHTVKLIGIVNGIVGSRTPTHRRGIIGGQVVLAIRIGVVVLIPILSSAVGGGGGFGGDDHTVAIILRQAAECICVIRIVEAHDAAVIADGVQHVDQIAVAAAGIIAAGGRAGGILRLDPVDDVLGNAGIGTGLTPVGSLLHLIAQRPEDHGGIVAVAAHRGFCRSLCPRHGAIGAVRAVADLLGEIPGEIIGIAVFRIHPAVEQLLNDQQAQFVADINEILVSRIMAGADGIDAHILHFGQLAIHGVIAGNAAQRALIVVQAHAVELDIFPVEMEAAAVEAEIAEAKRGVVAVRQLTAGVDLRMNGVEIRRVGTPQRRTGDRRAGGNCFHRTRADGSRGLRRAGRRSAIRRIDGVLNRHFRGSAAVVLHLHLHLHRAGTLGNVRRGDIGAVVGNVNGIRCDQGHITVNTAAGVPAAGGDGVDRFDCDHIFRCTVAGDKVGNVDCEGGVAIVIFANKRAIDVDIGVGVNAVKIQQQGLARIACRQDKALAVPAGAAGQEAGFRLAAGCKVLGNAEIVGQRYRLPPGIIEIHIHGTGVIAQIEFPSIIEACLAVAGGAGGYPDRLRRSFDRAARLRRGCRQDPGAPDQRRRQHRCSYTPPYFFYHTCHLLSRDYSNTHPPVRSVSSNPSGSTSFGSRSMNSL